MNPLQFNQSWFFDAYPRRIDDDLRLVRRHRCRGRHAAPTAATMYAPDLETHVVPGGLAERLEGPMRPGHFLCHHGRHQAVRREPIPMWCVCRRTTNSSRWHPPHGRRSRSRHRRRGSSDRAWNLTASPCLKANHSGGSGRRLLLPCAGATAIAAGERDTPTVRRVVTDADPARALSNAGVRRARRRHHARNGRSDRNPAVVLLRLPPGSAMSG